MRRLCAVAACLVLLVAPACTRRAATDPAETETDPAAHWSEYSLATGARHYEARVRLKGTARLGEGFVQALSLISPPSSTPPAPERDLPVDVELRAALTASITAEGDRRLVEMTYDRLTGHIDVAGVRRDLTAADVPVMRGGANTFAYTMAPDGSVAPVAPPSAVTAAPSTEPAGTAGSIPATAPPVPQGAPVQRGLDLSCPHPPPGGADPRQSWKIAEKVPLLGAAGTLLATNTYTLEGDNSAVVSSRLDGPLDTVVDLNALSAANPILAAMGGAAAPASAKLSGNITTVITCELTWPEQELLARTLSGHERLVLSFPDPVGPPSAVLGAGQFLVLDLDITSELRSV